MLSGMSPGGLFSAGNALSGPEAAAAGVASPSGGSPPPPHPPGSRTVTSRPSRPLPPAPDTAPAASREQQPGDQQAESSHPCDARHVVPSARSTEGKRGVCLRRLTVPTMARRRQAPRPRSLRARVRDAIALVVVLALLLFGIP